LIWDEFCEFFFELFNFPFQLRELRFLYDGNKKYKEDGTIDFEFLMVWALLVDFEIQTESNFVQTVGETIHQYLTYKNVEYGIETPDVDLIRILEDISIVDEEALEVLYPPIFSWLGISQIFDFRILYIVSHF
jgi:hypothetical protein